MAGHAAGRSIYLAALVVGALLVTSVFSTWAVRGALPPGAPPIADFAQQVVGQRYFLTAPWQWPILHAPGLLSPWGVNIAFTDSIPLAALVAKLLRPLLPPYDQVVTIWLMLCWVLQPVSAVFAVRSAGARGWIAGLTAAIMASSQPVFLNIFWHPSLSSHFLLLVMLGLYFRIISGSKRALFGGVALLPILLLVHPYLLTMGAAVLAAAPLTLWLRRDPVWQQAAGIIGAGLAGAILISVVLGYTAGHSPGGYGIYSMNLAAPVYPDQSELFPGWPEAAVNATGGQGYAYLGAGLIILLAFALILCGRTVSSGLRSHLGLTVVACGLFLLALSHRAYVGHFLLYALPNHVGPLQMFRASDRLFWVITYVVLVGGIVTVSYRFPRRAYLILAPVALLQFLDGQSLRAYDRLSMRDSHAWLFDPDAARTLLSGAKKLNVFPVFGCTPGSDMPLMEALWIAADTRIPTNTMYVARTVHDQPCAEPLSAAAPSPGDILLVQPGSRAALNDMPWRDSFCRALADFTACTRDDGKLATLPRLPAER
jgi:hypothetical protein